MTVTVFGVVIFLVGSYLLVMRSPLALLIFVQYLSLMGGSAAVIMTSLGGSSIPPATFALGFLIVACCLPQKARSEFLALAVQKHMLLVFYCVYGFAAALILPRLFAGTIDVTPMRANALGYIYRSFPLQFSNQNITTGVYMLGTMMAALTAHVAVQSKDAAHSLVNAAIGIAVIHIFLGVSSVLLHGTAYWSFLQLFRNGSYAQLTQAIGGIPRISGIMPEPTVYAGFAFNSMVFLTELWIRDIRPRATGAVSAALLVVIVLALSSKALVVLGFYLVILLLRGIAVPGALRAVHFLAALSIAWATAVVCVGMALFNPELAHKMSNIFALLTIDKAESESGLQRLYFAKQGLDMFFASYGLGVGPGSFRSSSLFAAIAGSTGILGLLSFAVYAVQVTRPLAISTYVRNVPETAGVAAAASWTIALALVSANLTAPSSDPGISFGILAGVALGLRSERAGSAVPRKLQYSAET